MTGGITAVHRSVATKFSDATTEPCVKVWCALHQLDLFLQAEYRVRHDEECFALLKALILLLRRKYNLIAVMESTCPKFVDTRLVSMKRCSK